MSKINEWDLLRREFDALTHDEDVDAESIERPRGVMEQAITTGLEINDPFGWNIEFGRELRFWRFVLPRVGNHR